MTGFPPLLARRALLLILFLAAENLRGERVGGAAAAGRRARLAGDQLRALFQVAAHHLGHDAVAQPRADAHRPDEAAVLDPDGGAVVPFQAVALLVLPPLGLDEVLA